MPRVKVLSPTLINKIAAGEVVVRPASVVKELVENSLDASATRINVEVTNGCRDILVADDGCGMAREDAELALVRHATSKIEHIDDLARVRTGGFRGEAVPSIAAVSRLVIVTRPAEALAGTELRVEGGGAPQVAVAAASPGTRVEVRDLFFNVPARRKFLKSSAAEMNAILQIVTRLALARPAVGFCVVHNGRRRLDFPAAASARARATDVLGARFADRLLDVTARWTAPPPEEEADATPEALATGLGMGTLEDATDVATGARELDALAAGARAYEVRGFLAHPELAARDRAQQYFFANGRPIAHRRLSYVLGEACRGFVMTQRYPVAVLFLEAPDGELDVNVHPTKEEVRFAREDKVGSLVFHGVRAALARADLMPRGPHGEAQSADAASGAARAAAARPLQPDFLGVRSAPAPGGDVPPPPRRALDDRRLQDFRDLWFGAAAPRAGSPAPPVPFATDSPRKLPSVSSASSPPRPEEPRDDAPSPLQPRPMRPTAPEPDPSTRTESMAGPAPAPLPEEARAEQAFHSGPLPRVLGQVARSFILAECGDDVMIIDQHAAHERLLYHYFLERDRPRGQQPLLVPLVLDLPARLAVLLEALLPALSALGFVLEPFGGNSYQVTALPHDLAESDGAALLVDLLEDVQREGTLRELAARHHRVAALLACKAAVKANHTLAAPEMERLLHDLRAARLPYTCPHGRPTMILLTRGDLEHLFRRK